MIAVVLDIAFGLLASYWLIDPHKHRCRSCGRTWRHLGITSAAKRSAHACTCGDVAWIRS